MKNARGYARVSTHEQNLDLQLDELNKAGWRPTKLNADQIELAKLFIPIKIFNSINL